MMVQQSGLLTTFLTMVNMESPVTEGEGSADIGTTDADSQY